MRDVCHQAEFQNPWFRILSIFYCCICDCPDHCCSFNAISPVLSLDCTDRKLFAWVQTSPISFVAHKGNRRRLHSGKKVVGMEFGC